MNLTSDELKTGLIGKDRRVIKQIYEVFLPMVRNMVLKNNGTLDHAMDVFQEGMVAMFEKLSTMDDHSRINFGAYFQGVCRFIWLKKLKEKQTVDMTSAERTIVGEDPNIEMQEDVIASERYELYRFYFQQLGADCQKVLNLFFAKNALSEIARKMNFTESYAKKKKHLCQKQLIESIEKDARYKKLQS